MNQEARDLWARALRAHTTATKLVREDPDASASRAYYAAFYAVSALFALQGKTFRKHSAVEAAVHRLLVKPGTWPAELGTTFSWLARLRKTGDYGGGIHVAVEEAQEAVDKASSLLHAVHEANPESLPFSP